MPPVVPGALPLIGHTHRLTEFEKIWNILEQTSIFTLNNGGISVIKICEYNIYILTDPDLSLMAYNICLNKMYFYHFTDDLVANGLITSEGTTLGLTAEDQTLIEKDYAHAFEVLSVLYYERATKPWLHLPFFFKKSALKRKQDKLTETVKNILTPIIQKRRLEMKMNSYINNENDDKFQPVLNRLLYLADEQNAFTDTEIREHLNTFVIAAYDTTTVSLTLILMMIGWHKDVQERIYNEIQEVLNNEDRDFTKNDLPKLVYVEAVIKETLRLYPTIPYIGRQVNRDIVLGKYTLPAGSTCGISLYGIHRHPMWGKDADQFIPDRWLDPARLPNHPNAFVAFGVGKRYCIGKQYSMMAMKTAIGHIVREYHVHSDLSRLKFQYEVVLQPTKGHRITFTKRK
ncbi:cytochrome P450 4C1-like isoform X2 [Spodoptera litura]|uniref:Cytochrome P450 4C1-like isoform X2 n=1 Tax=Spodoptera litura TaxID=69820 RepID=A0A9J7EHA3_SPOLT|nr:cytochrome P450 4C1-like isoform X2 [Spodoptera litura]